MTWLICTLIVFITSAVAFLIGWLCGKERIARDCRMLGRFRVCNVVYECSSWEVKGD